jgi:hypothetical protein
MQMKFLVIQGSYETCMRGYQLVCHDGCGKAIQSSIANPAISDTHALGEIQYTAGVTRRQQSARRAPAILESLR